MNWLVNFSKHLPLEPIDLISPTFASAVHAICMFIQISTPTEWMVKSAKLKQKKQMWNGNSPPKQICKVDEVCLSVCRKISRSTHSKQLIRIKCSTEIEKATLNILCVCVLLFYKSFEFYFKVLTCAWNGAGDSITKICAKIYEQIGAGLNE